MADRKDDPPLVKRLNDIIKDFDIKGGIIIIKNKGGRYRIAYRGLTRKEAQDALCTGIFSNKKGELDEQIQSNCSSESENLFRKLLILWGQKLKLSNNEKTNKTTGRTFKKVYNF